MLTLLSAELRHLCIQLTRYPAESLGGITGLILLFCGFFAGASYMGGGMPGFDERLDSLIIGYVVWTLAQHGLTGIAYGIESGAQTGALQQVFLSSYGALKVFISRALVDLVMTSIITMTVLLGILLFTGRRLDFSFLALLPIAAIMLGSLGMAFVVGALALQLKRVRQLMQLGQFALMVMIMTPFETIGGFLQHAHLVLPIVPGAGLLRDLLARGAQLSWSALWWAIANGLTYVALGLIIFHRSINSVRRRGSLGWH
jgi:ABC-2 type transport system permease protein